MHSPLTVHAGPLLAPRPPLAAYREDLRRRNRGSFGPSDATWLSTATILGHLVAVPANERPPLVSTILEVLGGDPSLREVLTAPEGGPDEDVELDALSPVVRAVVQRIEEDGAINLAYSTLAILAHADMRLSAIERGRVLAQMGRVAWKAGALDTSREHYRQVEVLGRAARSPELRARAWVGYSIVARLRGNYPEVRKWATRAAHEADRAGLGTVGALAYHSLMVSAGVAGDYDAALVYGWHAFQGSEGDPAHEADMLINLAQLLYETGHADAAIHGFAAALAREPGARMALPALGGLALAASVLGDADRVRAARAQVERLIGMVTLPYEAAATLVELSEALAAIGDTAGADACRERALEIATSQGYHELTHRIEKHPQVPRVPPATDPHPLAPQAAAVARAVTSLGFAGPGASEGSDGR